MSTRDLLPAPTPGKIAAPLTLSEPRSEALKLTHILVPTDFSDPARKALQYAEFMAGQFGAALTLLHVFELPTYAQSLPGYPGLYMPREDIRMIYDDAEGQAKRRLDDLGEQMQLSGLSVNTELRSGTPHQCIVQTARETGIDLIVIATHGYTGLKHLFLGGTAERVVRHAPCPVLVVRENERDFVPNA